MIRVASVLLDDRTVTVALSSTEKLEALRGNLTLPSPSAMDPGPPWSWT